MKNKIINEAKKIGICLVPFGFATKKGSELLGLKGKRAGIDKLSRYLLPAALFTSVELSALLMYGIFSLDYGILDYRKWPKIKQERLIQKEKDFRKSVEDKFLKFDINKNDCLNFEEFYDMLSRDYRGG